jgi:hypothetical protein
MIGFSCLYSRLVVRGYLEECHEELKIFYHVFDIKISFIYSAPIFEEVKANQITFISKRGMRESKYDHHTSLIYQQVQHQWNDWKN